MKSKTLKQLFKATSLVLFALSFSKGYSNHALGMDITYKYLDTMTYEFTVSYYRDCRGVPTSAPQANLRCPAGTASVSVSLKRKAIIDQTRVCKTSKKPCDPPNKRASKGIELHVFRDTIDFRNSKYKSLLSCAKNDEIIFEVGECCRNGSINTGVSGNFYTYAMIKPSIEGGNNSPQLASRPRTFLCCSQPVYLNMGAVNMDKDDSLSFAWAHPLSGYGKNISYSAGYSYDKPFTVYDPSGKGYTNPSVNPPIGLYLNPKNGDLIFTPTKCNETTVGVIEVKEWRKDSTGKYEHIGTVRRDLEFWVETCPGNNPPTIKGPFSYAVCAGDSICFTITTDDKPKKTPTSNPPPDTVQISWNDGIPNASFAVVNSKSLHQSGKFCWQTHDSDASTIPHQFSVKALDDHCPLNSESSRGFSVLVKERAQAQISTKQLSCNMFETKVDTIISKQGTPRHNWFLRDGSGALITDSSIVSFNSTGTVFSNVVSDSVTFFKSGTYIFQYTIDNPPLRCQRTHYDTITIAPFKKIDFNLGKDTFVCPGVDYTIKPIIAKPKKTYTYEWSNGDTTKDITVQLNGSDSFQNFRLIIKDDGECASANDLITLYKRELLWQENIPGDTLCFGETLSLHHKDSIPHWIRPDDQSQIPVPQIDTTYIRWTRFGKTIATTNKITLNESGIYSLIVDDSLGCKSEQFFSLQIRDSFSAQLPDTTRYCGPSTTILDAPAMTGSNSTLAVKYIWSVKDTSGLFKPYAFIEDSSLFATQDTLLALEVSVSQWGMLCVETDTMQVVIDTFPTVSIDRTILDKKRGSNTPPPYFFCESDEDIQLKGSHLIPVWGSKNNAVKDDVFSPSNAPLDKFFTLYYKAEDSHGCFGRDSVRVKVESLPSVNIHTDAIDKKLSNHTPPPYLLCVTDTPRVLTGSHFMSKWSASNASITDSLFSPALAPQNTPFYIHYSGESWTGCRGYDSVLVEVMARPTLMRSNDTLFVSKGENHHWFDSSQQINTTDSAYIVVTKNGRYHARVLMPCGWMYSDTMDVTLTGINPSKEAKFEVYPNPAKTDFTVVIPGNTNAEICLLDPQGRCVLKKVATSEYLTVPTQGISRGLYWLVVKTDKGQSSIRLTLQ